VPTDLARRLLGSRKRANLGATIVFQIGDPKTGNYPFRRLGMGPAGEQRVCQPRLGMGLASLSAGREKPFEKVGDSEMEPVSFSLCRK